MRPKKTPRADYYDAKLSDHRFWVEKGLDLHQAATAVEPLVDRFFHAEGVIDPQAVRPGIVHVYFLLLGYAVECLIKGKLTRKLLRRVKMHLFDVEKLPNKLKSHDLRKLCRKAEIHVWPTEERMLAAMTEAVEWRGRYPVPTWPDDLKPAYLGEADLQTAKSFLQRLMPRPRKKRSS